MVFSGHVLFSDDSREFMHYGGRHTQIMNSLSQFSFRFHMQRIPDEDPQSTQRVQSSDNHTALPDHPLLP